MIKGFLIFLLPSLFLMITLIQMGYMSLRHVPSPLSKILTVKYCEYRYGKYFLEQNLEVLIPLFKNSYLKYFIFLWLIEGYLGLFIFVGIILTMSFSSNLAIGGKKRGRVVHPLEASTNMPFSRPFKAGVYQAAKVSQLFRFNYNDMISRNGGRPMFKPLTLMLKTLGFHLRASMIRVIYVFLRRIFAVVRSQGVKGAALGLKAAHIQLMHALAGYEPKVRPTPIRLAKTRRGIPRIIPCIHRKRIQLGDERVIRLWMSLFSIYRVLKYPGMVKLETITGDSPFSSLEDRQRNSLVSLFGNGDFLKFFWLDFMKMPFSKYGDRGFSCHDFRSDILEGIRAFGISKSGPFTSKSQVNTTPEQLYHAASVFYSKVGVNLLTALERYVGPSDNNKRFLIYLLKYSHLAVDKTNSLSRTHVFLPSNPDTPESGIMTILPADKSMSGQDKKALAKNYAVLGKLGFKEEAAGKVRVFAMVDAGTQGALHPLHKYLFKLLRAIPMDATFDQDQAVKSLSEVKGKRFFSFDLSAATDRLPIQLQVRILSAFFGSHRAQPGADLLVGRYYYISPGTFYSLFPKKEEKDRFLKYKVGQPMGALSSGAMLAVTHHYIVQFAGGMLGNRKSIFRDYRVLGDDVVIFNRRVASKYRGIMKVLGLEINLSKSVLSNNSFEFAKRFVYKGKDVSPLSLKEVNGIGENLLSLISLGDKWEMSLAAMLSYIGAGYRALGSFTSKKIRGASPKMRVALLYFLRSKTSPYNFYTSISMTKQYQLDPQSKVSLVEEVLVLYKDIIMDIVRRKVNNIEKLKSKYEDNALVHQVGYSSAVDWVKKLEAAEIYFNSISRQLRLESVIDGAAKEAGRPREEGADQFLKELRLGLSVVSSCPDFTSIIFRRRDGKEFDHELDLSLKVFVREVGIWMTINSGLSGHNFKVVPLKLDVDSSPENPLHLSEQVEKLTGIYIFFDILKQVAFSIPGMSKIWRIGGVPSTIGVVKRKSRFGNFGSRKGDFKDLPRGFFFSSYPYSRFLPNIWIGSKLVWGGVPKSRIYPSVELVPIKPFDTVTKGDVADWISDFNLRHNEFAEELPQRTTRTGEIKAEANRLSLLQYIYQMLIRKAPLDRPISDPQTYTIVWIYQDIKKLVLPSKGLYLPLPYIKRAPIEFIKFIISFLGFGFLLLYFDPLSIGTKIPYEVEFKDLCESYTISIYSNINEVVSETQRGWGGLMVGMGLLLLSILTGYFVVCGIDSLRDPHSLDSLPSYQFPDTSLDQPKGWPRVGDIARERGFGGDPDKIDHLLGNTDKVPTNGRLIFDEPDQWFWTSDSDLFFSGTWWSTLEIPGITILRNIPEMGDTGELIYGYTTDVELGILSILTDPMFYNG